MAIREEIALLRKREQELHTLVDSAPDAIFVETRERFAYVNPATLRLAGADSADQLLGEPVAGRLTANDATLNADWLRRVREPGGTLPPFEAKLARIGGAFFDVEVSAVPFHYRDQDSTLVFMRDITERKRAEEQLLFIAYHDALTGLPNRGLAKDRFSQAAAYADRGQGKVALMLLDLDDFKTINDSLGHSIGDELLKAVTSRIVDCLRGTDTVARLGGDEFLIMLPNAADSGAVITIAEKILELVAQPFFVQDRELSTSVSIGAAVYPDDGENFDTLFKLADTAMYSAKEAGRNTYRFFDGRMNTDVDERLRLRNNLRLALEREEFAVYYQPQVDFLDGTLIGAEALVRWNHPDLGLVLPGRFISIAEDCGLIIPIGEWVLREACRQTAAWQAAGLGGMVIAVNLSAVQFKRGNIEDTVISALTDSGLDPGFLELELTESLLINDTEKVVQTLRRLKELGVKLSIDDFGTGYSSLAYLKRFAVDKLKIDQSFVRDLMSDPNDAAIVLAIIQMAASLGMRTIAEGVENEQQQSYLRTHLCDEAQGFHLGRPMPAAEFGAFFLANRQAAPSRDKMSAHG